MPIRMSKISYSDKLKDPRWQRKRLEVFSRDNFTCTKCGDDKNTLHVHHLKYSGNPWDVSNESLITTCQRCHSLIEYLTFLCKEMGFDVEIISIEHRPSGYSILLAKTPDMEIVVMFTDEFGQHHFRIRFTKEKMLDLLKKFD